MDQLEELEEEDLDALFEEFGEVVRSDKDSTNVTSEVDEDSDSLACKYSGTLVNFPFLLAPFIKIYQGFWSARGIHSSYQVCQVTQKYIQ